MNIDPNYNKSLFKTENRVRVEVDAIFKMKKFIVSKTNRRTLYYMIMCIFRIEQNGLCHAMNAYETV